MRYLWENPFINHECQINDVDKAPLNTNVYETYAQCNEDLIIEAVLRAQMSRTGRAMSTVRYIEIGANHPFQTSSTYLLHRLYGATGVLVEPIPTLADALRKNRPNDVVVNCTVTSSTAETVTFHVHDKNELSSISAEHIACFRRFGGREGITETIECQNLHINNFMKTYGSGQVDYLSIDAEGLDFDLLCAMDPAFQPTIIQCEQEGMVEQFSLEMNKRGYGLLAVTDVNVIFVRKGII